MRNYKSLYAKDRLQDKLKVKIPEIQEAQMIEFIRRIVNNLGMIKKKENLNERLYNEFKRREGRYHPIPVIFEKPKKPAFCSDLGVRCWKCPADKQQIHDLWHVAYNCVVLAQENPTGCEHTCRQISPQDTYTLDVLFLKYRFMNGFRDEKYLKYDVEEHIYIKGEKPQEEVPLKRKELGWRVE